MKKYNLNILKPIKKKKIKEHDFLVWDIEASALYPGQLLNTKFLGAGLYDGDEFILIDDEYKLFELLLSPKYKNYTLYAHNGSRYDYLFVIPFLAKNRIKCRIISAGSRAWVFFDDRVIADSYAIVPTSLQKAGIAFNVKTLKSEINYQSIEHENWQEYLKKDCISTYEVIDKMRNLCNELNCELKLTAASTALDLYRRNYQKINLEHNPEFEEYERMALFGGRTELFQRKAESTFYYDINSSYSCSALENLPYKALKIIDGDALAECRLSLCECDIPYNHVPALPFRDNKLLFPYGKFNGWYTGIEIDYARALYGYDSIKVIKTIIYESSDFLAQYSRDIYSLKKSGNPCAKILLNGLYGRFALNQERGQIYISPDLSVFKKALKISIINEEYDIYGVIEKIKSFCFPAIFAHITAHARIRLHKAMCLAGNNLIYCDTDSVISKIKLNLPLSNKLGDWKLESSGKSFQGIAPKTYIIGDKTVIKGFKKANINILEDKHMTQVAMHGLKETLKKNLNPGLNIVDKKIHIEDNKRRWIKNKSEPIGVNYGTQ